MPGMILPTVPDRLYIGVLIEITGAVSVTP